MDFEPFTQPAPALGNQYTDDRVLRSLLKRLFSADALASLEPELTELGALAGGPLYEMQLADRLNEPVLTPFDAWGKRIDHIEVSPVWKAAERIAAERGIVATAYERKHGYLSRVHQFALAYLFTPATDIYSCPLAMTDAAAHTLLKSGNQALIDRAVPHLTSRDPKTFWTSGQWMTESTGGSDVGQSETVARKDADGTWRLYGRKWFTSAATSQIALTLGRPEGNGPGGHGLAMFYVETRDAAGALRNIEVCRLKDKLGTRKVPTAELMLHGTPALLVAGTTDGIRNISPMLNVTRAWNAVCSVAGMRRGIALARDYAKKRVAFGAPLSEKPLHLDTLADLQAKFEAAFHFCFYVVTLLGKDETGEIDEHERRMLRLLTPLVKLTTGKQVVSVLSEVLECFGGAGYVEDTGIPVLYRDAQVLPIWEGTTNVLSLDALRAIGRDGGIEELGAELARLDSAISDPELKKASAAARAAYGKAGNWLLENAKKDSARLEAEARRIALTLGESLELALLARHADWALQHEKDARPKAAALRFLAQGVDHLSSPRDFDTARALANDEPA